MDIYKTKEKHQSKKKIEVIILLTILTIAGLSTILRPSIDSKLTLFRVILPFVAIYLTIKRPRDMRMVFFLSGILLVYTLFIINYASRFQYFDLVFYLYNIILLFWYYFSKYLTEIVTPEGVYRYLKLLFKTMIILAYIQMFFGGTYINTPLRPTEVNIFFINGNEFSGVLGAFIPLYLLKEKGIKSYLWLAASFYIIFYNDARLSMIAVLLFVLCYFFIKVPLFKFKYWGLIVFALIICLAIFFAQDYVITPGLGVYELLIYPVEQIINLEPVYHIGSINSRINAVIFGTRELIDSYFLGIGPGNSHLMMLEQIIPGKEEASAYSMHNFVYQIITELGVLGMAYLIWVFNIVKKGINSNTKYPSNINWIYYVSIFVNLTMLSGPYANYFFLFIFFYSIFFFKYNV